MKTLLIIDANLGQARAYMAKPCLERRRIKRIWKLSINPNDAELAIVLGESLPSDNALNGKKVWLGDIGRAVAHPELFLSEAKSHATPYSAPTTAVPVVSGGPKRGGGR
ncbi:PTS system, fructose-specific IIBC component [Salmonella bongori]|nr:PTS system, fructose-specific IIBC component [Salmonella bongori]